MTTLVVNAAAAFANFGAGSSRLDAAPVASNPTAYRMGVIVPAARGNWISRLRVPVTFALLSMSSRKRLNMEAFEKAPLARGQIEVTRLSETRLLVVDRIRFWSDRMKRPRYFLILVPKAPLRAEAAFILNHGWFDRPEYMLEYLHVADEYDAVLERGEVRPAIVAIPDVRFESMLRLRSDPDPPYLRLVAEEIPAIVSRRYSIPLDQDHWAIGGFSFGGYISLDIGRRYPGRFASVSVVSGFFDPKWTFWPASSAQTGKLEAGESDQNVLGPGRVPRLFLACGTNDWLFATMRSLHYGLAAIGFSAEWSTAPGGHTWKYWSSVVHSMLLFHLGREPGDDGTR
jgi:enterochelin esterase-like enzyme